MMLNLLGRSESIKLTGWDTWNLGVFPEALQCRRWGICIHNIGSTLIAGHGLANDDSFIV